MPRGWLLVAVLGGLLAACGLESPPSAADDEFSAESLGDPPDDFVVDVLTPAEREARERSQLSETHLEEPIAEEAAPEKPAAARGPIGRTLDTIGKVGVSIAVVGASLAAAAAPFLLL